MKSSSILLGLAAAAVLIPQAAAFSLNTGEVTQLIGAVTYDTRYAVYRDNSPDGTFDPNDVLYGNPAGLARVGQVTPQWVNPGSTPAPNGGKWISPGENAVTTGTGGTDPNPEYFHFVVDFTVYSSQVIPVNFAADNSVKAYLNGSLVASYSGFNNVGSFNLNLTPGDHQVVFSIFNAQQATGNPAGLLVSSGTINVPDNGSMMAMLGAGLLGLGLVRRRMA